MQQKVICLIALTILIIYVIHLIKTEFIPEFKKMFEEEQPITHTSEEHIKLVEDYNTACEQEEYDSSDYCIFNRRAKEIALDNFYKEEKHVYKEAKEM